MWWILLLVPGLFTILAAAGTVLLQERFARPIDARPVEPYVALPAPPRCVLCHALLQPKLTSTEEVVFELERWIGDERATVVGLLDRGGSEDLRALYLN